MNKVYTLHDAVAKFVEDGDCISFGGFTTNRKPYAVVGEILRQGQKDFTVWAGPAGGDWDMLIGEGREGVHQLLHRQLRLHQRVPPLPRRHREGRADL